MKLADLKPGFRQAISIFTAKPKSRQADKIFSSLKKEMSLYEAIVQPNAQLALALGTLRTI